MTFLSTLQNSSNIDSSQMQICKDRLPFLKGGSNREELLGEFRHTKNIEQNNLINNIHIFLDFISTYTLHCKYKTGLDGIRVPLYTIITQSHTYLDFTKIKKEGKKKRILKRQGREIPVLSRRKFLENSAFIKKPRYV